MTTVHTATPYPSASVPKWQFQQSVPPITLSEMSIKICTEIKQFPEIFLISNFLRVLNAVCFLLGDSPTSEVYIRRFGTLGLFHLHTPTCLWKWNRQSFPKRRHINFRRRGITQKQNIRSFRNVDTDTHTSYKILDTDLNNLLCFKSNNMEIT
jgi:hypothetical protein